MAKGRGEAQSASHKGASLKRYLQSQLSIGFRYPLIIINVALFFS